MNPKPRFALTDSRRKLLEALEREAGFDAPSTLARIPRIAPRAEVPCSFGQERLWFLAQIEALALAYNMPFAVRMSGQLDVDALRRSLAEVVQRHQSLRTTFAVREGRPTQVIHPAMEIPLEVVDLTARPPEEREEAIVTQVMAEARHRFDLDAGPLLRTKLVRAAADHHVLVVVMHHIIADGWSMGLLVQEVSALYTAFVAEAASPLPPLPIQYADFASWQRDWLAAGELDKQLDYWSRRLEGTPPALELPTDRLRPPVQGYRGARYPLKIDGSRLEALRALSRQHDATLHMTLLAAFAMLLARWSGQRDMVIGTPVANRNRSETERLIGFFVNMLPIRLELTEQDTFGQLLTRVRGASLEAYANQDLPFERLVEALHPERDMSRSPIVQVAFVVHALPTQPRRLTLPGLELAALDFDPGSVRFDLMVALEDVGDEVFGAIEYASDLFEESTIARICSQYCALLDAVVSDPGRRAASIELLSREDRERMLVSWNETSQPFPEEACLSDLVAAQAKKTPDRVSVVCGGAALTYAELDARANRLAAHIRRHGAGPEVRVAVCVERSVELVVALLAVLKAGAAYVPLDPNYPRNRVAAILADARCTLALTTQRWIDEGLFEGHPQLTCLDVHRALGGEGVALPVAGAVPQNLGYVIYTSGSTGRPKGVAIQHRSATAMVSWALGVFTPRELEVTVLCTSICFDLSIFEIFVPLACGGRVVVAENALRVLDEAEASQATLLNTVPSAMAELVRLGGLPASLRCVNVAGEPLSPRLVEEIYRSTSAERVFNLYGPTEDTTYSTVACIGRDDERVTIGRPVANSRAYVLDSAMDPTLLSVVGELYLGGEGLARGYLDQPAAAADRFLPDPFSTRAGERLYRTGDLVRWLPDGDLDYIGRRDHQIKLRGYRIELAEIESALLRQPGVCEAVVMARDDVPGDRRIVAYVVPGASAEGSAVAAPDESHWRSVWDETYRERQAENDVEFNIVGWNSSYTGQPIPTEEMREWIDHTARRILALQPRRLWEIGCGTGLVLFRVGPVCEHYHGSDISEVAVQALSEAVSGRNDLGHATLRQRAAHDFDGIEPRSFDAVVLNSVAQYFPSLDYFLTVIEGAVEAVADGGFIFLGDLRSLPLLEAFHSSVQLHHAAESLTVAELRDRIRRRLSQEKELVFDPRLFEALRRRFPRIHSFDVELKRGQYQNELTQFRYDVVLRIGAGRGGIEGAGPPLDYRVALEALAEGTAASIVAAKVPNLRVAREVRLLELLKTFDGARTVADLRESLASMPVDGVDPEQVWRTAEASGYVARICWSNAGALDELDIVAQRPAELSAPPRPRGEPDPAAVTHEDLSRFANRPMQQAGSRDLTRRLREHLAEALPEYMVPSAFVVLEALPRTPNGKIDRRALPVPPAPNERHNSGVASREPIVEIVAQIWAEVLGLSSVAIDQNFFELGGHSLLAAQVVARAARAFEVALPVTTLFENPTVAQFARRASGVLAGGRMAARKLERAPRDAPPSLSFAQERFWFLRQLAQGGPSFNLCAAIRIEGSLDVEALRRSIEEVVRRHEVLRTTYRSIDGRPTLLLQPPVTLALPLVDLSELAPAEVESQVGGLVDEEAQRSLSLEEAPLIRTKLVRLGPTEHLLIWTADHIAWDGQSTVVAALEVAALYPALRDGGSSPLAEPAFQYADYAASQRHWLSEDYLREQVAFWKAELAGAPDTLDLPFDRPRPPVQSHRGASVSFELPAQTISVLRDLARGSGATLYMALLAGFNALVCRYTGQTDIVVGTPIANRGDPELEALVGPLINGLPLRTRIAGDPTFTDLLASVRRTCLGAYAHQDTPVERLVQELVEHRDLSRSPLFQLVFALHTELPPLELDGLRLTLLDDLGKTFYAEADLAINLWQAGDRVRGTCVFATDLFEPATVTRMMAHFRQLLEAAAASPGARIGELALLPDEELQRTLIEWNRSAVVWVQPAELLHQAMERHADAKPSAVAVVSEGQRWTYGDLEARANQLASYLRELGAGPDVPVALCVERSFEMVVGILGILKAGAAYVPLDPAYRKERLAFMLTDARAPVLLTQERLVPGLPDHAATVVCLDRDWPTISERSSARAASGATPDNLAYVIYTSGSTGTPKGIAIRHRGVLENITDLNRRFEVGAGDSVLCLSSLSFDMCVYEVLGMLEAGATVIMPDASASRDPAHWAELIRRHRVTIWNSAPALLVMLLDHLERGGAAKPAQSLRLALLGGDWVPVSAPDRLRAAAPDVRVIVMGGATEASIHSIIYEVDAVDPGWISIPYGRPMANQTAYVLDPGLQPVPVGVPGELFLGGVGLARGYFERPELTADRFVPHPFPPEPGMRLYRTGDLARYRVDGTIELIGRVDFQVKIRGVRIELGEIVSVLREHPAVRDAVVVASDHDPRERKLVAYVVWQAGSSVSQVELRRYIKDRLPEYMVPSVVTVLERLPLSPNGKIDRRALPPPSSSARDLEEPFVEPRTDLERVVCRMCCEVLDVDGVGVNDSFFDLGGNSLLAIRLQAQIRDVFELEAPLRVLFGAPTVARLAEALAAMASEQGIDLERVAGIVLSVDAMSDEEALAQVSGVLGDARVEEAG